VVSGYGLSCKGLVTLRYQEIEMKKMIVVVALLVIMVGIGTAFGQESGSKWESILVDKFYTGCKSPTDSLAAAEQEILRMNFKYAEALGNGWRTEERLERLFEKEKQKRSIENHLWAAGAVMIASVPISKDLFPDENSGSHRFGYTLGTGGLSFLLSSRKGWFTTALIGAYVSAGTYKIIVKF